MKQTLLAVLFFISALNTHSFSQDSHKYEREYGLDPEDVPQLALQFLGARFANENVNWYFEENLKGNSVEAKFEYHKRRYSIEFDTTGNLQDIEVEWKYDDLPDQAKASIKLHLSEVYKKFGIEKIQIQYSGQIRNFEEFLSAEKPDEQFHMNYEIVVKGKKEKSWNLYEITLDASCNWEHTSEIVLRNTDNLIH